LSLQKYWNLMRVCRVLSMGCTRETAIVVGVADTTWGGEGCFRFVRLLERWVSRMRGRGEGGFCFWGLDMSWWFGLVLATCCLLFVVVLLLVQGVGLQTYALGVGGRGFIDRGSILCTLIGGVIWDVTVYVCYL
jgi:hypothetical protein